MCYINSIWFYYWMLTIFILSNIKPISVVLLRVVAKTESNCISILKSKWDAKMSGRIWIAFQWPLLCIFNAATGLTILNIRVTNLFVCISISNDSTLVCQKENYAFLSLWLNVREEEDFLDKHNKLYLCV